MINAFKKLGDNNIDYRIRQLFSLTQSMFIYSGDDNFRFDMLEFYIQLYGYSIVAEHEGNLYPFFGGYGGDPNPYYEPTNFIVANPALHLNKTYTIDEDCILFRNTHAYNSMFPLFKRYSKLLEDNELTMNIVAMLQRAQLIISASDDGSAISADKYIKDLFDGRIGTIADPEFLEGIKVHPYPDGANTLRALIEYNQYLLGTFYHTLGLNSNFNLKRESIVSAEADLNTDVLIPLIDNMLKQRKKSIKKVNDMFNVNWGVKLNEPWLQIRKDNKGDILSSEHTPRNLESLEHLDDDNSGL